MNFIFSETAISFLFNLQISSHWRGAHRMIRSQGRGTSEKVVGGVAVGVTRRLEYSCLHCPRAFQSQSGCVEHQKVMHENFKNVCPYCGKVLASRGSLRNHVVAFHTKNSQLRCDVCNKVYISRTALASHMSSHHRPSNLMSF